MAMGALVTARLRRRTAIHEAGHVVAAFALGGPRVVKVSIVSEGTSLGRVSLSIPAARWEELRSEAEGSAAREQFERLVTGHRGERIAELADARLRRMSAPRSTTVDLSAGDVCAFAAEILP